MFNRSKMQRRIASLQKASAYSTIRELESEEKAVDNLLSPMWTFTSKSLDTAEYLQRQIQNAKSNIKEILDENENLLKVNLNDPVLENIPDAIKDAEEFLLNARVSMRIVKEVSMNLEGLEEDIEYLLKNSTLLREKFRSLHKKYFM